MSTGGPAGPVPTPTHWARVQLMQGASPAGMWDLTSQLPEARVTVGSGPEAGWNVQAPDVMPVHFELYWDGKSLWVGPPVAGSLTADGEPVVSWRQLSGRTRLEFGRAAMLVEASQSIEVAASIPTQPLPELDPDAFAADDATAILEAPEVLETPSEPPPLEPDATRMLSPEHDGAIPRPGLGGALGSSAAPSLGGALGSPAAPSRGGALGSPSVGGAFGSTATPGMPSAQASVPTPGVGFGAGVEPAAPPPEFKTRILDTEAIGVRPSNPPAPPAPMAPPVPSAGGEGVGDSRPTLAASDLSTDVLSFRSDAPAPREIVGPGGAKFALPPIDDGSGSAAAKASGLAALPKRTWVLLGVTVAVAIAALGLGVWKKNREEAAAAAAAAAEREAQAQEAQAHAEQLRQRIRADAERLARERERLLTLVEPEAAEAVRAARERVLQELPRDAAEDEIEAAVREASRLAVEKLAADAAVSNDLRRALGLYQRLQRDHPRPEYEGIVEALRAKLECRRGVRRDGTGCS